MWESEHLKAPKTMRGEATLRKIFKAAESLASEKSFYEFTVNDVTKLAGIGMGTFYLYFNDKMSLHRYMLEVYSHEIRKTTAMATARYTDRYTQEFYGLKAYLQYIQKHPIAYRIIWESQHTDPVFFKSYYENFCEKYIKGLQEGVTQGEVLDCDLTAAAYLIMGGFSLYGLKKVIFDQGKPVVNADVEAIMRILRYGLFPPQAANALPKRRGRPPKKASIGDAPQGVKIAGDDPDLTK